MRAILSVYDKSGLVPFAQGLVRLGFELYSTGGTKKALTEAAVPVKGIEELTGFPEILDGRVKTLHPAVHGGILARRDLASHREQLERSGIKTIDLVAVNLYPFRETVSREGATLEEALENIDIGGPTMLRAAAKNFPQVLVVMDPADYPALLADLGKGEVGLERRRRLAQKAFQHVASYDTAIAAYLREGEEGFPEALTVALRKRATLRYGENPHQQAAFYADEGPRRKETGLAAAQQLWGKEMSFNNYLDADAAWAAVSDFSEPAVAIIKHTNPCGLACHPDLAEAYRRAFLGDPLAAFGGIVAVNRPLDLATAREIDKTFYEILLAPGYQEEALALLQRKKDLRILLMPREREKELDFRRISGGFLLQTVDAAEENPPMRPVTRRQPTAEERKDLLFAWKAVRHVKSNAIVLARDQALLGMGAGQPSRVVSVELALARARERARGSVLASDAFFPFPDGVELAGQGGVTAIVQPGGSVRDEEAITVANRYNIAMVFTGIRHFRH